MAMALLTAALPFVAGCGKDSAGKPVEIRSVSLGYDSVNEYYSRFGDGRLDGATFVAFNSRSQMEAAAEYGGEGLLSPGSNRYRYGSGSSFRVRTLPEDALVRELAVTSSDRDVIEVVGVDGKEVSVAVHAVGDAELTVTVKGALNEMTEVYPVRVVMPVDIEFYINSYWEGAEYTRLKYRAVTLPMGLNSCAAEVQDSVSLVGYCEWYDLYNRGAVPQVRRDTLRLPMREGTRLLSKFSKSNLRNISSAVREIRRDWYVEGTRVVVSGERRDTVPHRYGYIVEQVILDFNIYGANPNYEYYFHTRCDRTNDVLVVDDDGVATGEVTDGGTDGDEDCRDGDGGREFAREETDYFVIRFNDFLTQEERDRRSGEFSGRLEELGYDEASLSEEEKRQLLEDLENGNLFNKDK